MSNTVLTGNPPVVTDLKCYHCGLPCEDTVWADERSFCCYGCKAVYEILSANDLCEYYSLDQSPGARQVHIPDDETFKYIDAPSVRKKILAYDSLDFSRVRLYIPAIHCASCIWLLEHLERLNPAILKSEVNFVRKTVTIDFHPQKIRLSKVASILSSLGYAPKISLEKEIPTRSNNSSIVTRLAVAGFCFGNVMLFSFPEYLGLDHNDRELMRIFAWLNVVLSVPVLFYSASDYFKNAGKSFQQRQINIDVPIALGLIALFGRSLFDIITSTGPGYLDSFTGLVFFLLIGRWFQSKTYESLAFDRDFRSYFPLAVYKQAQGEWKPVVIYELERGDRIRIRNMEIVPADCILIDATAFIDYSFVTGESKPVKASAGDIVYAGGRLVGQPVTLMVEKKTDQSHLTSLWNNDAFKKVKESAYTKIIDRAARTFTWIVVGIAIITGVYWNAVAPHQMWLVVTAVLMVACPCALALAAPFTYGSMLRVFGRHQLYLKNADVIERLGSIDAVVFDKTGTVTRGHSPEVTFSGTLTNEESIWIKTLTGYSTHPLSNLISKSIKKTGIVEVTQFKEVPGKGLEGNVNGNWLRIGSSSFTGTHQHNGLNSTQVFVQINGEVRGYYSIHTSVRNNVKNMLDRLGRKCVALLSGDNEADKAQMSALFNSSVQLVFNQSPHDKLHYIQQLQQQGKKLLMIGDGLNDSGALQQSDVGLAVTDDTGLFTPACDGILHGDRLNVLDKFIQLAKSSTMILKSAFVISFLYNGIALGFAVTGNLTPLVAAILMPLSSISVVSFSSITVKLVSNRILHMKNQ
jgi:Cu+-exporting ATPase